MSALTAALAVRISPETDRLRRELQAALKQPANKIVERALVALKAEIERHGVTRTPDLAPTRGRAERHAA
jgi:hypothetical protein